MKAIFFVMKESDLLVKIVDAWKKAGLTGVTVLDSYGAGMVTEHGGDDSLPMFGSVMGYLRSKHQRSNTLISVVEDDRQVEEAVRATETVMGDLAQKGKGILFVVPLDNVVGYRRGKE
ncbi:MAG: hypothetical protein HY349_08030 [Nitrospirae bacterium]|nr:hypothetical protein [Nitrospirota bacterium]